MNGDPRMDMGVVKRLRDKAAAARGSLPQLDRAFRPVEWLLEWRTSP